MSRSFAKFSVPYGFLVKIRKSTVRVFRLGQNPRGECQINAREATPRTPSTNGLSFFSSLLFVAIKSSYSFQGYK